MRPMRIGELAERTGLSLPTIRYYDEIGLVPPTSRTEGGFRLYSEDDLRRLLVIRRMKPLGYSVDEMRAVLALVDALAAPGADRQALRAQLQEHVAGARARRDRLARHLDMADEFIGILEAQDAP